MRNVSDPTRPSAARRHPVVVRLDRERAESVQLSIADRITAFAGSMPFVYVHVVLFACWMVLLEESPWPTLTLVVSLEAIFLSTFVLIAQNRQAAFQQAKADHDFAEAEQELRTNTEVTRAIHELIREIRERQLAGTVQRDTEDARGTADPRIASSSRPVDEPPASVTDRGASETEGP
jgi:uncharacterized membrane protein